MFALIGGLTVKAFFTSEHSFVSVCIEVLIRSAR